MHVVVGNAKRADPILDLLQELEQHAVGGYQKYLGESTEKNCVAHILMADVRPDCFERGQLCATVASFQKSVPIWLENAFIHTYSFHSIGPGAKIHPVLLEHARQYRFKYVTIDATMYFVDGI